jgi:hypothetical protein
MSSLKMCNFLFYFVLASNLGIAVTKAETPQEQNGPVVVPKTFGPFVFAAAGAKSSTSGLTNNGCTYTGGSDTDMSQMAWPSPMEGLINSCKVNKLPVGCKFSGPPQSRYIQRDLSNCQTPFTALNASMISIASDVPSGTILTNVDFQNGNMITAYGPYRLNILVTFRPISCKKIIDNSVIKNKDLMRPKVIENP